LEEKIGSKLIKPMPMKICEHLSHYRYGLHCYSVDEAKVSQSQAKSLCSKLYGDQATLVMIKDQYEFNFISKKLPDSSHSYWVGVKQDGGGAASNNNNNNDSTQSAAALTGYSYFDGSQVPRDNWMRWHSGYFSSQSGGGTQRNCVALSFDGRRNKWFWNRLSCHEKLNYVCQYFILQ